MIAGSPTFIGPAPGRRLRKRSIGYINLTNQTLKAPAMKPHEI
jgi:hypothetical protein